jgi:hypothetical protein
VFLYPIACVYALLPYVAPLLLLIYLAMLILAVFTYSSRRCARVPALADYAHKAILAVLKIRDALLCWLRNAHLCWRLGKV